MTEHNISINRKYFEPIRNGDITLLVFNKKIIHKFNPGDFIVSSYGSYEIKARITKAYLKAFSDITNKEAKKAGFLNKDFLKDELIHEYGLEPSFNILVSNNNIDDELFFLIELRDQTDEEIKEYDSIGSYDKTINVTLYSKEYNKEFYNPEYDTEPWSDKIC